MRIARIVKMETPRPIASPVLEVFDTLEGEGFNSEGDGEWMGEGLW